MALCGLYWGAYGKKPDDTDPGPYNPDAPLSRIFATVHCAQVASDGMVYVCDRVNNRIQVFKKDGTFVKEAQVAKRTLGDGAIFDLAFDTGVLGEPCVVSGAFSFWSLRSPCRSRSSHKLFTDRSSGPSRTKPVSPFLVPR